MCKVCSGKGMMRMRRDGKKKGVKMVNELDDDDYKRKQFSSFLSLCLP